ncbi:Thiopurine S-methyltransferase [Flavobacterium sp. CECT 9288]|uniref:methyltransferase domain-containing protein n=1 Tax=Flavobacterium sp. CECT 9288 TaxID=2845819 RepID=UPI001E28CF6F|nr:methyltransferase domain-containing protein [Flavobacterium sp. CECT 9288]CAH0336159.1 Thiopurine S-methyltransferase [Flavobacterium sp. CECT 9288]
MSDLKCCIVSCEQPKDANYWESQYVAQTTKWDLGTIAPPLQEFINTITNKDCSILIPGCGNSYEAEYLLANGFSNITVIDIAPSPVAALTKKHANNPNIKIIQGDFFTHSGQYDCIIEQTFFCAIPPFMRQKYLWKMHQLLAKNGVLAGLLFNRNFEAGPPFGGSQKEYESLFENAFQIQKMEIARNSVAPRANSELFFMFEKKTNVIVNLYELNGVTCSTCAKTIESKLTIIEGVVQVSINTNFQEIVIVSHSVVAIEKLQDALIYDASYSIAPHSTT